MDSKKYILSVLLIWGLLIPPISSGQENQLTRLRIGDSAPLLVSFDIFGATINSKDWAGQKLWLISFFGTYCQPCIAEFPDLNKLYSQFKDNLVVVMINKGKEDREELKKFRSQQNLMDFYMIRDRFGVIGDPFGVDAVPVTILVGKNGKVLYTQYGAFEKDKLVSILSPIIRKNLE
jgi:thiol-disulfide isomerase/thioredoxin